MIEDVRKEYNLAADLCKEFCLFNCPHPAEKCKGYCDEFKTYYKKLKKGGYMRKSEDKINNVKEYCSWMVTIHIRMDTKRIEYSKTYNKTPQKIAIAYTVRDYIAEHELKSLNFEITRISIQKV